MRCRFSPEETEQRAALLGQSAEALPFAARVFPRNDTHVAGQRFSVCEPPWIAEEDVRCQRGDRSHPGMRQEQLCPRPLPSLVGHLLSQLFDFLVYLTVQCLHRSPTILSVRRQLQELELCLSVVTPQARTASQSIG